MTELLKMAHWRKIYLLLCCTFCVPPVLYAQEITIDTLPNVVNTVDMDDTMMDSLALEDRAAAADETWEGLLRADTGHRLMDTQKPFAESDAPKFISPRNVDAVTIDELKAQKEFRYEEQAAKNVRTVDTNSGWYKSMAWVRANMTVFFWIFFGLLLVILLVAILQYATEGNFSFTRRIKKTGQWTAQEEVVEDEHLDYDTRARNAMAAGNLRLAVRFLYLHSLEILHNKQLIVLGPDKTNADYLRDLRSTQWHQPFSALTLAYEYVWYGEVNISNRQFDELNGRFAAFKNELR